MNYFKKSPFILFGLINFLIFHVAIVGLYFFLNNDRFFNDWLNLNRQLENHYTWSAMLINLALLTFFTAPHSVLLSPFGREFTKKFLPPKLHMTFYALHASVALLTLYYFWIPMGPFYKFTGPSFFLIVTLQALSWLLMAWAMLATGPMKQIGMEQWWKYLKEEALDYKIPYGGPYKYMRHPIYLSFFGMILFNPYYSLSHLLILFYWGIYLYWGAKQKDLRYIKNKDYKKYAESVPFIPFIVK